MDWKYLPQSRIELLIALSRLIFASFSLLAIYLDPSQPARYSQLAYGLMMGYVIYSLALALAAWQVPHRFRRLALTTHIFDLAIFTVFMFFTEGYRSPFFAYIIFSVMCATLRWHWRGALYTFIAALAAFIGLALYGGKIAHDPHFNLETFIIRGGYLAIITLLLSYTGAQQLKMWEEFTGLAQWPKSDVNDVHDLMGELLSNVCSLSGAPRSLVLWEESDEPWMHAAFYSGDSGLRITREAPDAFGEIVPGYLVERNFFCFNAELSKMGILCDSDNGFEYVRQISPISPELESRYKMRSTLSMNLQGERFKGRLFILDKSALTSDDLIMGKIIAARASEALGEYYLVRELRCAAVAEERINLARDLHDGLLQSLAGIGMKIKTAGLLIERDSRLARQELACIGELLTYEQRDLRCLIHELKPFSMEARKIYTSFKTRLEDLVSLIRQNWGLQVELHMENIALPPAGIMEREVYFVLREALVNAAKHAAASNLRVDLAAEKDKICVVVTDNGCGFPFRGQYDLAALRAMQAGPATIKERIGALGGTLTIDSNESGARLKIQLPLPSQGSGNGNTGSAQ